jgi:endonuclease/exonuclease/phosphatase family metal-dependent hydrolase
MRRGTIAGLLVAATVLGAATLAPVEAGASRAALAHAVPSPVRLRVMTFNIEYGGTVIDFDSIVRAAVRSDADVIALNEAYAHTRRLAREAGFGFWSTRLDVVSRYPLLDPPHGRGRYLFVQVAPGSVVAISNVHLSSTKYGPRGILDGWHKRKVLRFERSLRLPEVRPFVRALGAPIAAGIPSFLVGDFNAPSHQDYTAATVGLRPQMRWPIRWPVSSLLARRGFTDTFRGKHGDPARHPGITWPSGRPRSPDSWNPRSDAPRDRIDQIWVAGGSVAFRRSQVVGERGGPGVDIGVAPWGSDHRAVVSTVDVTPAVPPVLVSADPRLVDRGDPVTATYHAPGAAGERVVIVPSGGDPATDAVDAAPTPAGDPVDGSVGFATGAWASGGYDAVLVDAADAPLSRYPFWVREPGAPPRLRTDRWSYRVGEPITVTWEGAPANRWDWIGVYRRGADPLVAYYKAYLYTRATVAGATTFRGGTIDRWPFPPGRYTMYYLLTDVYRQVARADFVIRP